MLVRQFAWNMATPPQRKCVKLCVGIFNKTTQETSYLMKTGKITETLCKYLCTYIIFMYEHNRWP